MPLARLSLLASLVAASEASCTPKATLGKVDIGTRVGPKGALLPATTVDEAQYLGCDVRFENLREGDEIKIEWRWKRDEANDEEWRTSKRETVKGTGNGTLRADLGSDSGAIDPGVWECDFHVFSSAQSTATADASGKLVVGRKD